MGNVVNALRVLVVDDYEDNGEMLAEALGARGYNTRWVTDAAGALAIAGDFRPDIAVLDILLPDMNGYDLGRKLHAMPGLERVCLIAITGFSRDPGEARAAGFHGHVLKPVSLAKLEVAIGDSLRSARGVD